MERTMDNEVEVLVVDALGSKDYSRVLRYRLIGAISNSVQFTCDDTAKALMIVKRSDGTTNQKELHNGN